MSISVQQFVTSDVENKDALIDAARDTLIQAMRTRLNELSKTHLVSATLLNLKQSIADAVKQGNLPDNEATIHFGQNDAFAYSPKFGFTVNLFWEDVLSDELVKAYQTLVTLAGRRYEDLLSEIEFTLTDKDGNAVISSPLLVTYFDIVSATEYRVQLVEIG